MRAQPSSYRRVTAYLVFGVLTTLVNVAVYAAFAKLFGVAYLWANVIAWAASVIFAYVTNKLWVFGSRSAEPRVLAYEMATFVGARLASLALDTALMYLLVSVVRAPDLWSKVFVNVVVVVVNYAFSKLVVFRARTV
jgi:putative flippase GtrA